MIHSSIIDNWMRVEVMHSVAEAYYQSTYSSEFRERMINGGQAFPFDTAQYEKMEKESCIVGMVMAWSVITLESLVNHTLAETLNNRTSAIMAIEYPRQITDKLKIAKCARSELAKKIVILADSDEPSKEHIVLADELSEKRNLIVHDKPFELIDYGDGNVDVTYYKSRGDYSEKQPRYDDLATFYAKCDSIKNYVTSISPMQTMDSEEISFTKLIKS